MFLVSCGTDRNTSVSRQYQAFITRYNVQYNGEKHYNETLEDMEKDYRDDFSKILPVHPAESRGENSEEFSHASGDFTRSIEKAQKAIQLHSIKKSPGGRRARTADEREWKQRSEYNPYLHNSWMLLGKAQYMQGDFEDAAAIFLYISRHFKWLPETVTEARIWEALCYSALGRLNEAQDLLDKVNPDQLNNKILKLQYNMALTSVDIKSGDFSNALVAVENAIKYSKGPQKIRLQYIKGQLLVREGENETAYNIFKKIYGNFNADYRLRFNARVAASAVTPEKSIRREIKSLNRMLDYESNNALKDQIYYALGNLYIELKDTVNAINMYKKADEQSVTREFELALSMLSLANIYYDKHDFIKAQEYYSQSLPWLPDNYPDYNLYKKRSEVLDRLSVYVSDLQRQDSLLKLSKLTLNEQREVCDRLAKEFLKQQKEMEKRESGIEDIGRESNNLMVIGNNMFIENSDVENNLWYFYNSSIVTAGRKQFQRIWGNRKLEDDWRRKDKRRFIFSFDDESVLRINEVLTEYSSDENSHVNEGLGTAEYYMKDIPVTTEDKQKVKDIIQEDMFNIGLILKNDLDDFNSAETEFKKLLSLYPDNIYRLEIYHNLFLLYARIGDLKEAEYIRQLIATDFPDSSLGIAMKNPDYLANLKFQEKEQDSIYDKVYTLYLHNRNDSVHKLTELIMEKYPLSPLMPKFLFIDALAFAADHNKPGFKKRMKELLGQFPESDVIPVASRIYRNFNERERFGDGSTNMKGIVRSTSLINEMTEQISSSEIDPDSLFKFDSNKTHIFIFAFPLNELSSNQLLYDIARHNFTTFMVRDFDLETLSIGEMGLIIVRGFNNFNEVEYYLKKLYTDRELRLPKEVISIPLSEEDFRVLIEHGLTFDDYFHANEKSQYESAQEKVLSPDDYEIEKLD